MTCRSALLTLVWLVVGCGDDNTLDAGIDSSGPIDARTPEDAMRPDARADAGAGGDGGVVVLTAQPDDGMTSTWVNSEVPSAQRRSPSTVSEVDLDPTTRHLPTDAGSWLWTYHFGDAPGLDTWVTCTFVLVDRDITEEMALTGDTLVAYARPDVDTTVDLEIVEGVITGVETTAAFRVALRAGEWNRITVPESMLVAAGADLTDVLRVTVRAYNTDDGLFGPRVELHLSMIKGP